LIGEVPGGPNQKQKGLPDMPSYRSIACALTLGAAWLCLLAASSASATTLHECLEATGTAQGYTNGTCSVKSAGGKFHTVPIGGSKAVVPSLTPTTGTGETHAVLHGVIGGIAYKITCTGVTSSNSEAENEEVGGVMSVVGHGKANFSGCSMPEPSGSSCAVPTTLETNEMTSSTKKLTTTYKPAAGLEEKFITFTISGCTGGFAVLNGSKTAKGTVASVTEAALPTGQMFTSTSGSSLTFGGQSAVFEAVVLDSTENGTKLALEEETSEESTAGMTLHQCKEEAGTAETYSNSSCSVPSAEGHFRWVPIAPKEVHAVVPALTPTTGTSETHAVLRGLIAGGIRYKITCTGLTSSNSEAENEEVGGVMSVVGHGKAKFSGCYMPEPSGSGCTVPTTLETNELNSSTKEMTTTYKPAAGLEENFITFTMSGCTGGFNVLNGSKTVKGAVSSVTESSLPTSQMFTETSGSNLTFGGQPAQFEAVIHLATENGVSLASLTP
jgi:hypothetical protein